MNIRRIIISILILLLLLPASMLMAQGAATAIAVGDSVEGILTSKDNSIPYSLHLEEGSAVYITLNSDDFDTYLRLFNSVAQEIASNDDNFFDTNSSLTFIAPSTDTYIIHASEFFSGDGGSFTLTVLPAVHEILAYGDEVTGNLAEEELNHIYSFEGKAGDVISIALNSEGFDSYLRLFDADDYLVTSDDDSGGNGNALIGAFALPADSTYRIHAGGYVATEAGEYTLTLNTTELVNLSLNEPIETTLEGSVFFVFEAEEGDMLDVLADAPDLRIEVTAPDGYWVGSSSYNFGEAMTSLNNILIEETGTYRVTIATYSGEHVTDPVTVTLQTSERIEVGEGEAILIEFDDSLGERIVNLPVNGAERIKLTLRPVNVDYDHYFTPTLDLAINIGTELFSDYRIGRHEEATITFSIEHEGDLTLKFSTYAFEATSYELEVERLSAE